MPRRTIGLTSVETRIKKYGNNRYYVRGYKGWTDPFPEIQGTLPEKMVYARLSQLGVPFLFLNDIAFNMPEAEFFKEYQADFVIPAANIIIEIQGTVWHSKPAAIEADSFKFAVYESFGYKALAWWDYEIFSMLDELIAREPLLMAQVRFVQFQNQSSELPPIKRTRVDTSKGIRTLNQKYKFKAYKHAAKIGRKGLRKPKESYAGRR